MEEVKEYLSFSLSCSYEKQEKNSFKDFDVLLIHEDYLKKKINKNLNFKKENTITILMSNSNKSSQSFDEILSMPTSVKELNTIVENSVAKKSFNKNSSINVKGYILDKNEKKLIKESDFIFLTEKEIQLIEIFLSNKKKSIGKNQILKKVWNYSTEADTHTVETHIYRLRKKIKDKFSDEDFILNSKEGYLL